MALFALDGQRMPIGDLLFRFVNDRLLVYLQSDLEHPILMLATEDALDLAVWLALHRRRLYDATMRGKVDAFKEQVCAECGLTEKRQREP